MKRFPAATAALRRRLGARVVRTDEAELAEAAVDGSKLSFRPEARIRVRREADGGVVLALANRYRVPVTTRGRGTTLTGSAVPVHGGWVLDLLELDSFRIDSEAGMAHVQAGSNVAALQSPAEDAGWFYPPDPSSR